MENPIVPNKPQEQAPLKILTVSPESDLSKKITLDVDDIIQTAAGALQKNAKIAAAVANRTQSMTAVLARQAVRKAIDSLIGETTFLPEYRFGDAIKEIGSRTEHFLREL
jgi:hypothetical protein